MPMASRCSRLEPTCEFCYEFIPRVQWMCLRVTVSVRASGRRPHVAMMLLSTFLPVGRPAGRMDGGLMDLCAPPMLDGGGFTDVVGNTNRCFPRGATSSLMEGNFLLRSVYSQQIRNWYASLHSLTHSPARACVHARTQLPLFGGASMLMQHHVRHNGRHGSV